MGYLICEKCEGYYELRPGEDPEEFEECECGGELEYKEYPTKNPSIQYETQSNEYEQNHYYKNPKKLFFLFSCGIITFMVLKYVIFGASGPNRILASVGLLIIFMIIKRILFK